MGKQISFAAEGKDRHLLWEYVIQKGGSYLSKQGEKLTYTEFLDSVTTYMVFRESVVSNRMDTYGYASIDLNVSDVIELRFGNQTTQPISGERAYGIGRVFLYSYRNVPVWLEDEYKTFVRFIKKSATWEYLIAPHWHVYIMQEAETKIKTNNLIITATT